MFRSKLLRSRRFVDVSKDTQFTDAWLIVAVILLVIGLVIDNAFFSTAAVTIAVLVGVTWAWGALSLAGLTYERRFSEIRAFQGEQIQLTLTVSNRKPLPLTWLSIEDSFPAVLPVDGKTITLNRATNLGEFRSFWMPNAFQRVQRHFTVDCVERGFHRFGPTQLSTGDGFGFFGRTVTLPEEQRLIVYPRLYSVDELNLPAKNPFGERRAHERLFEDPLRTVGIREWQQADDPRRIHWKATARHGEMLSRLYEPSREEQIVIVLNVATMLRHWHGIIPELMERVISVAASLAVIAAEERHAVGLIANGVLPGSDQPLRLLPGRAPDQVMRILELLAAVTPFASTQIETLLLHEAPRLSWGATIVVVTAIVHDDLLAALLDLVDAGRRVVLFTLAEAPPERMLPGVIVYHAPGIVEDLIVVEGGDDA
ncbi:MAG: DUF58 domain-containing protein [Caldilineaceae bacterium]